MRTIFSLLLLFIAVLVSSCAERGCTDPDALNYNPTAQLDDRSCTYQRGCVSCRAVNYEPNAVSDDGSCEFVTFDYTGSYEISDSVITEPGAPDSVYNITVDRDTCGAFSIVISNYANRRLASTATLLVAAEFSGDSFFIPSQQIIGVVNNQAVDTVSISSAVGFFKNDSIFFPVGYSDVNGSYVGFAAGPRI